MSIRPPTSAVPNEGARAGAPESNASGGTKALLGRANPVTKLGAAMALTAAALVTVDWVSAAVVLLFELTVLPLTGLGYRRLVRRAWPIAAAALMAGYSTALLAEDRGRTVVDLGIVTFSEGSLGAGGAITLRSLAIALPGILVLSCTDPTDLADALAQKLRLPHRFVLGALAAIRLVGLLMNEWRVLALARRARGAGTHGGWWGRVRGQLAQGLSLMVQAIRRATRLAVTMEARGFGGGERTWARASTYSGLDVWIAMISVLVAGAALGASLAAGTWNPIWI